MHLIIFLSSHHIHRFFFLWEISYPDGGARAKNRANKNRRGLGETLPNHPPFFARPTFSFRPRFTMWTLRNKLVLNFVVCLASLRLWKDSIQFFYVESNIDNNYSSPCRWLAVAIYRAAKFFFCLQMRINSWICKQKKLFHRFYRFKLPSRISSPSSCISGTACLIICDISLLLPHQSGKSFCS